MARRVNRLHSLFGTLVYGLTLLVAGQARAALVINVDTAGCNTNVAINGAIGQSFRVGAVTQLDKIEVWIKPELYYTTSYGMELYDGEGTGGTRLATSPTTITLGSQTAGVPSAFQAFTFSNLTLQPNRAYTFRVVRLSQYSGAFSMCGNVYGGGIQYWLGYYSDTPYDMSFRVYGGLNVEPLAWQVSGPGTRTATPDGSAADGMSFDYSLSGSSVWSPQQWAFYANAPRAATVDLDWNYSGFHAWYNAFANARAFVDGPGGRLYINLLSGNPGSGGWNINGTQQLRVCAGYPFGFIIDGQNFDSDARLMGSLKVATRP